MNIGLKNKEIGVKNNQGLSLIELIVVVALMGIIGTIAITSFGLLNGQEARECAENISAALDKGKIYSMTKSGTLEAYLEITKKSDGYYVQYYIPKKAVAVQNAGEWVLCESSKIGKASVEMVCSFETGGDRTISEGVILRFYFDRLTGAFKKTMIIGPYTEEFYCKTIRVSKGKSYQLDLVPITGKHTLKRIE